MNNQCNCDCGDSVLKFTVKEINQILLESIINCSTRYSPAITLPLQLSLEEALPLVPDEYKSVCRILVFLNKDDTPKPEMWVYASKSPSEWLTLENWVQVPLGFSGIIDSDINDQSQNPVENQAIHKEFQKVVYSEQVRDIKIVDKAVGAYDNTLYLELIPMDKISTYQVQFPTKAPSPVAGDKYKFSVNVSTYLLGKAGIELARLYVIVRKKPDTEGAKVIFSSNYHTDEGESWEFVNGGFIGDGSVGFPLPADCDENIDIDMTFSEEGEYTVGFKFININGGNVVVDSQQTFHVI